MNPDIARFTKRNIVFRDGRIIKDIETENRARAIEAIRELKNEDYLLN